MPIAFPLVALLCTNLLLGTVSGVCGSPASICFDPFVDVCRFFDVRDMLNPKSLAEKDEIWGQTGARLAWHFLLAAPPARGGRRLKNSCFAAFISSLPVDLEVRYCRKLQQGGELQQGGGGGIYC